MQNNIKMSLKIIVGVFGMFLLVACGGEYIYRKDVEQLSKPGALDLPLTSFYSHYQYKLLGRYKVKHQWLRESVCKYRSIETEKYESKDRLTKDRFFTVRDIFEEGGSTWQRFDAKTGNYNFDRFVRAEYLSGPNGYGNYRTEKGYNPICFESWWTTSNYIRLRLQKRNLDELAKDFTERYPEGSWTTRTVNNLTWRVQETPEGKFRNRPLNGVGGPYQSWLIPIGDTSYTMAIELGASKESLQYPEAHARMQVMFKHLIESVKIEPIQTNPATNTSQTTPTHPSICSLDDHKNLPPECKIPRQETTPPLNKIPDAYTLPNEHPDKAMQLQQDMQKQNNRQMKDLLRSTALKTGR